MKRIVLKIPKPESVIEVSDIDDTLLSKEIIIAFKKIDKEIEIGIITTKLIQTRSQFVETKYSLTLITNALTPLYEPECSSFALKATISHLINRGWELYICKDFKETVKKLSELSTEC